ncbi:hypothetical protein EVAR_92628_1 [Eumeta japonica]|uniref:Uncharacterized protein n=1 Tax=Eumeta variegata TaxID=151549 RepID=A0A4C1SWV7_EUMVA|nr:hypothetical protein EVAR_92628_1 [Eumeta japonica]
MKRNRSFARTSTVSHAVDTIRLGAQARLDCVTDDRAAGASSSEDELNERARPSGRWLIYTSEVAEKDSSDVIENQPYNYRIVRRTPASRQPSNRTCRYLKHKILTAAATRERQRRIDKSYRPLNTNHKEDHLLKGDKSHGKSHNSRAAERGVAPLISARAVYKN